jgi:hypothetical protein
MPKDDDIERFTERSKERRQLFEDAATSLPTSEISRVLWAFLQVADLEKVRELTSNNSMWKMIKGDLAPGFLETDALDAVLLWSQRKEAAKEATPASRKRTHDLAFPNQSPSSPLRTHPVTPPSATRTRSGATVRRGTTTDVWSRG